MTNTPTSNNVIYTKHAQERMDLRRISHEMILQTLKKPAERKMESDGDIKFIATIQKREVHVVAHYLDDEQQWLIKSAWVRGEDDPQPLWKQLLTGILRLLGFGKSPRNGRRH